MKKEEFEFESRVGKMVTDAKKNHLDMLVKSQQQITQECKKQQAARAAALAASKKPVPAKPAAAGAAPLNPMAAGAAKQFMNTLNGESKQKVAQAMAAAMMSDKAHAGSANEALAKAIDEAQ